MENPEEKMMKWETPEKNKDWAADVMVPVPLNEYVKLKMAVVDLEHKLERANNETLRASGRAYDAKEAYEKLKKDYQKLLGIKEEGDDGK